MSSKFSKPPPKLKEPSVCRKPPPPPDQIPNSPQHIDLQAYMRWDGHVYPVTPTLVATGPAICGPTGWTWSADAPCGDYSLKLYAMYHTSTKLWDFALSYLYKGGGGNSAFFNNYAYEAKLPIDTRLISFDPFFQHDRIEARLFS